MEDARLVGSAAASTGDLLVAMWGSLTSLAYTEIGPLTVLGKAEEAAESHQSAFVAAQADNLLMTMCRGLLTSPAALAHS